MPPPPPSLSLSLSTSLPLSLSFFLSLPLSHRYSQFQLKVGELGFPIHFVCGSTALYHRGGGGGYAAAIFPLGEYGPLGQLLTQTVRQRCTWRRTSVQSHNNV